MDTERDGRRERDDGDKTQGERRAPGHGELRMKETSSSSRPQKERALPTPGVQTSRPQAVKTTHCGSWEPRGLWVLRPFPSRTGYWFPIHAAIAGLSYHHELEPCPLGKTSFVFHKPRLLRGPHSTHLFAHHFLLSLTQPSGDSCRVTKA